MSGNTDPSLPGEDCPTPLVRDGRYSGGDLLDAALERGIADADAGRVTPADEVRTRLIKKYETMPAASA